MKKDDHNMKQAIREAIFAATAVAGLAGMVHDKNIDKSKTFNLLQPRNAVTQTVDTASFSTTEKLDLINQQVDKIFAKLEIENLHDKSAEEQKQAAYKILKHLILSTRYVDIPEDKTQKTENQSDAEVDKIYQTLCMGANVDSLNSESLALSMLYNLCGLDSKCVTIERHGKTNFTREVVMVDFADGQCICDPIRVRTIGANIPRHKLNSFLGEKGHIFIPTETYYEKYANEKHYQVRESENVMVNDGPSMER